MKVAIPIWLGRVSPVFDVAGRVLVIEIDAGREQSRREWSLDADGPAARAARLLETGADVLICGAISLPLEQAVADRGIQLVSRVCGDVEQVIAAFLADELHRDAFLMPGCCGRRRRRGRRGRDRARGRHHGSPRGCLDREET